MPATSEAQRKAAGMALAYKRGQLTKPPGGAVKQMAKMSTESLRDFARKPKKEHHKTPMRYHKRG
jgi:hypothetical protein